MVINPPKSRHSRCTIRKGTVERTAKSGRKFRKAQPENHPGFTGTGRDVRPIRTPRKSVVFQGKRYYVNPNIAG